MVKKYLEKKYAMQITDKNVSKANFLQLSLSHVSGNSASILTDSHVKMNEISNSENQEW